MASSAPSPSHEAEADVERGHHHHPQPPRESQDRGGQQQDQTAALPRPPFAEPRGIHLTRKDFRQQGSPTHQQRACSHPSLGMS